MEKITDTGINMTLTEQIIQEEEIEYEKFKAMANKIGVVPSDMAMKTFLSQSTKRTIEKIREELKGLKVESWMNTGMTATEFHAYNKAIDSVLEKLK